MNLYFLIGSYVVFFLAALGISAFIIKVVRSRRAKPLTNNDLFDADRLKKIMSDSNSTGRHNSQMLPQECDQTMMEGMKLLDNENFRMEANFDARPKW